MSGLDLVTTLLTFLGNIPVVGHYLSLLVSFALPLTAVVTALVAVWHAVVGIVAAVAALPGMSKLQGLADSLKADEDKLVSFENSWILPILNRLSMLPLPASSSTTTNPPASQ
jgi:hypothetical protein